MLPPRASTDTITRSPKAPSTSSRKSTSREGRGAEDHPLGAGAQRVAHRGQRAQPAAVLHRAPRSSCAIRSRCSSDLRRARRARRRGRRRAGSARPRRPTRARPRAGRRGRRSCRRSRPGPGARPCRRGCRSPGRGSRGADRARTPRRSCASSAQPVARGLLGVELHAVDVAAPDDRGEALAVLAAAEHVGLARPGTATNECTW